MSITGSHDIIPNLSRRVGKRIDLARLGDWVIPQKGGVGMKKEAYEKPVLIKHENLKEITFECPNWQCSVTVPPPPA
ncbi:hypothetical protein BMS3Abin01_01190 [bacterium BMS3Abin01]|nr:hypothetical protein BMS3Abin01_01190 [bacterium BMS3Abin01]